MSSIFLMAYLVISAVNVAGEFLPFKKKIRYITTPLALPLLIAYVLASGVTPWLLVVGLLFSLAGDVILMFPEKRNHKFFLAGTLCFMVTHFIYYSYFLQTLNGIAVPFWIWLAVAAVLAGSVSLFIRMWKNLGFLRPVIGLYSLVLGGLASLILLHYSSFPLVLFLQSLIGILLFLLSDAVLSQDWFIKELKQARPIAMITYFAAQLFLVHALVGLI